MHDILVVLVHSIVTVVRRIKPGGLRAVVAESALTRHQILILAVAADACSNIPRLGLSLGYEDLEEGSRSLRKLCVLDFQVACFGHGKAILKDAVLKFRRLWT